MPVSRHAAATQISPEQPTTGGQASRWYTLAYGLIMLVCALTIGAYLVSLPTVFATYSTVCTQVARTGCADGQPGAQAAVTLLAHGVTLQMYAGYTVILLSLVSAAYVLMAAIMLWRQAHNPMTLFAATFLITFGVASNNGFLRLFQQQNPAWNPLLIPLVYLGDLSIVVFFCVFPTGRFAPRWTWWVLIAYAVYQAGSFFPQVALPGTLGGVIFVALIGAMALAQIYRYRRISTATERKQTKWVVMGLALTIALEISFALPFLLAGAASGSLYDMASNSLFALAVLPIPISIYIAIVRHRLYDIDLLINRALVYGLLTAALAAVYFGAVIGSQTLTRALTGQGQPQQPVVIVLSTLLIAALFQPLRTRLQRTIDRRFYRRKYNVARTLATFGQTLRTEVEMESLCEHLVAAVEETMQPASVSLWLRAHTPSGMEAGAARRQTSSQGSVAGSAE